MIDFNYNRYLFLLILFIFLAQPILHVSAQLTQWETKLDQAAGEAGAGYNIEQTTPEPIIGLVIQAFLSILGVIFLVLMILAGYNWMTAHGEEQKVTKAKDTLRAAIIGLIIVLGAYAISIYVIDALSKETLISTQ